MSAPMDASADVEKKLGLSLDDLIKQQAVAKKKPAVKKGKGAAGGKKGVAVPAKAAPGSAGKKGGKKGGVTVAVARVKAGGVKKGGQAPKQLTAGARSGRGVGAKPMAGGRQQQRGGGGKAPPRVVKITIGNSRAMPPGRGAPAGRGVGGAPPPGSSLSNRYDRLHGAAPAGRPAPTGQPRRNAHGVILP